MQWRSLDSKLRYRVFFTEGSSAPHGGSSLSHEIDFKNFEKNLQTETGTWLGFKFFGGLI